MLCEKCQKKDAVVHFKQVIGNQVKNINLCKECAQDQGLDNPLVDLSNVFGKLIVAVLSEHLASKNEKGTAGEEPSLVCEACGLSWNEFKTKGRLGCTSCYDVFHEELKHLIRRIHGTNRHIGSFKKTRDKDEKETFRNLEKRLKEAVANEQFEIAAQLRDRLREKRNHSKKLKE